MPYLRLSPFYTLPFVLFTFGGCNPDVAQVGSVSEAVTNGTKDRDHHPGVVLIDDYEGHVCSGVLIDDRRVLTAAHCTCRDRQNGPYPHHLTKDSCDPTRNISFYLEGRARVFGKPDYHNIGCVKVDPSFELTLLNKKQDWGNYHGDLAVLILPGAPPTDFSAIPVVSASFKKRDVSIVGFGRGACWQPRWLDDVLALFSTVSRRQGTNQIERRSKGVIVLDDPGRALASHGDSGGPLLVDIQHTEMVAGITNLGSTSCDYNEFADLASIFGSQNDEGVWYRDTVMGKAPRLQACAGPKASCSDLDSDLENCGGCGHACSNSNVRAACAMGSCDAGTCLPGFADCNHDMRADGCEVDLSNDVKNCGGCGKICDGKCISKACSTMITFQPDAAKGIDTFYGTVYDQGGGPSYEYLSSGGWADFYYDFIAFDLSGLPSAAKTAKVELWLSTSGYFAPNDPMLRIHRVTEPWTEEGVTLWDHPASAYAMDFGPLREGWNAVDITTLYKAWKEGIFPNYGIELVPLANDEANGGIAASDHHDPDLRPKLVITTK